MEKENPAWFLAISTKHVLLQHSGQCSVPVRGTGRWEGFCCPAPKCSPRVPGSVSRFLTEPREGPQHMAWLADSTSELCVGWARVACTANPGSSALSPAPVHCEEQNRHCRGIWAAGGWCNVELILWALKEKGEKPWNRLYDFISFFRTLYAVHGEHLADWWTWTTMWVVGGKKKGGEKKKERKKIREYKRKPRESIKNCLCYLINLFAANNTCKTWASEVSKE